MRLGSGVTLVDWCQLISTCREEAVRPGRESLSTWQPVSARVFTVEQLRARRRLPSFPAGPYCRKPARHSCEHLAKMAVLTSEHTTQVWLRSRARLQKPQPSGFDGVHLP